MHEIDPDARPMDDAPLTQPEDQPPVGGAFAATDADAEDEPLDAAWDSPEAVPPDDETEEDVPGKPAIPSLAAIGGHPIHPMLVPIPIGALSLALASDLAYAVTRDRFWARTSVALLGTGIVSGVLAGAVGSVDFLGRDRVREHGESWLHAGGNVAALALSAANLALRRSNPSRGVLPAGLALSTLTGGILAVTGWLGGELSYRHRVGVTAD